jgi:hypothetical protein
LLSLGNNFQFARNPSRVDAKRGDHFPQADLNEAAGAADASRAMLWTSCPSVTYRIAVLAHAHSLSTAKPIAYGWTKRLNSHSQPLARICRKRQRLPSSRCIESAQTHRARVRSLLTRAFDTTLRLPGTNLLDEWIGDLPLIAEVVASQLAKITCPTGRQYNENRFQRQSASPGL